MGGFKLTKEDLQKPMEKTFWDVTDKNVTGDERELLRQQQSREMKLTVEESVAVDQSIKQWQENPALHKNVLAVIPKKTVFMKDNLLLEEERQQQELDKSFTGAKLERKTRDLKRNIEKQRTDRRKKATDLTRKYQAHSNDMDRWIDAHMGRLDALSGRKRDRHIAGLNAKMRLFVEQPLFLGELDSEASMIKALEKIMKLDKDMTRMKLDSTYFSLEMDEELLVSFNKKMTAYESLASFLKKMVAKTARGEKRELSDFEELDQILGDSVLVKGTAEEKIFNYKKEEENARKEKRAMTGESLKTRLKEIDIDAQAMQVRKGNAAAQELLNESAALTDKTREIDEKWNAQGEETPVFDNEGKPVMVPKLNPLDYSKDSMGEWKPFLDENNNPVMIQKTEAKKRNELRKRLNLNTEKTRFGGMTKNEIQQKLATAEGEEFETVNKLFLEGMEYDTHMSGYSGEAFQYVNNALRYNKFSTVKNVAGDGAWSKDVKQMVNDMKHDVSHELPEEVCLTRHGDLGGLACMFGLDYNSVSSAEELFDKLGKLPDNGFLIRDKAFLSTTLIKDGVAQGGFRQAQVEFRILAPKGTKGLYIESLSQYPETEQEMLLDAGTIFRVTKLDATGRWTSSKATANNDKKVIVYMEAIPKKTVKKEQKKAG